MVFRKRPGARRIGSDILDAVLRRDLLRAILTTPLLGRLRPWWPFALPDEPDASGAYRRAFALVDGLAPGDRDRLGPGRTIEPDDPGVDALLERARPVLEALREGSSTGGCRWGETLSADDLGKGHLDVLHLRVVRVAGLSARRHAAAGREREALDDLFAGLTLAHRVGTGGVLFARVLESAGEASAFQALARILPGLKPAGLDDLAKRLDALPPPEPASATIGPESRFIVATVRVKILAKGPTLGDDDWADLGFDGDEAAALRRLTGDDRAALLAHLDATGPAFAELARRLDLPHPDCRPALDAFARDQAAAQPVVASLAESAWGARHVVDRMRTLRALTRAGLALVRDGEAAFRAVPDPFGPGPFALERRGRGFLIRSAQRDDDRPEVALSFGDAP